jgi:UDP-N-acetylglucosamine:LPS N-acetylglucosamine transferase
VKRAPAERLDVLLVCSPGGHLLQLHMLEDAWRGLSVAWVTLDKSDARSLLSAEQVFFANGPTARNLRNLFLNVWLALSIIRRHRPRAILTTGAGIAVPFAWIGRVFGAHVVYIESVTRIDRPSLTLRLVAPCSHQIYAQWSELVEKVPRARYVGSVFGS